MRPSLYLSNHDVIEIPRKAAVRKNPVRLGQQLLIAIASRNVGEDKELDAGGPSESCRFRRRQMSIVARNGCVSIQKRRLDHQDVGVANMLRQPFRGLGVTYDNQLLASFR